MTRLPQANPLGRNRPSSLHATDDDSPGQRMCSPILTIYPVRDSQRWYRISYENPCPYSVCIAITPSAGTAPSGSKVTTYFTEWHDSEYCRHKPNVLATVWMASRTMRRTRKIR